MEHSLGGLYLPRIKFLCRRHLHLSPLMSQNIIFLPQIMLVPDTGCLLISSFVRRLTRVLLGDFEPLLHVAVSIPPW